MTPKQKQPAQKSNRVAEKDTLSEAEKAEKKEEKRIAHNIREQISRNVKNATYTELREFLCCKPHLSESSTLNLAAISLDQIIKKREAIIKSLGARSYIKPVQTLNPALQQDTQDFNRCAVLSQEFGPAPQQDPCNCHQCMESFQTIDPALRPQCH